MTRNYFNIQLTLFVVSSIFTRHLSPVPITFNTALAISKDEAIIREQIIVRRSTVDSSGRRRKRTEQALASTLVYGVTPTLAFFSTVPFTARNLETPCTSRHSQGIGDVRFIGRYTIAQQDFRGGTFRVAPFAGVKVPTGTENRKDCTGTLLPRSIQTGSGSWDALGGMVVTYGTVNWQTDIQPSFKINSRHNGFRAGSILRFDLSVQHRLHPARLRADTIGFLIGLFEMNLIFQSKNKLCGASNDNTGGTILFLSPGFQYAGERVIAEIGVQIPTIQNLNGTALHHDVIVRAGARFNF